MPTAPCRRCLQVSGWWSGSESGSSMSGDARTADMAGIGAAPASTAAAPAQWEARFRAPRILWVRMAAHRQERAIACTNVSGVYQIHRWQVGEPVGEALTAFPTGKTQAWISPDGERVIWHADRAGDEVGHFVAVPWSGGDEID